jgi:GMP synthase-like glutamine amidotransferase
MKKILIIKHVDIEGPGTIEEFLVDSGWNVSQINLGSGEMLPASPEGMDAVICMGGPMNAYEEEKYPFLKNEDAFIKQVIAFRIPFLGLCLGAQLLAKAAGAKVMKAPAKEIGWYQVSLTKDGKKDRLFRSAPSNFMVFQWHEDTFELPENGVLLARSDRCENQAFRIGKNAYGLQFHIEVTPPMIESWLTEGNIQKNDSRAMLDEAYLRKESYSSQANSIYMDFADIIKSSEIRRA